MPPVGAAVAEPLQVDVHVAFTVEILGEIVEGCVIVVDAVPVHDFESVTVTVYVAADRLLIFDELTPEAVEELLQDNE